ncbi:MAG TPA: DegT/DnrJ/EryC1/StrS family aminotransferase [Candidatus Limnocylindrales bacterium]|nr:DegT/DnrJ/EryC1/StrS family aminotransferase [Candidatus Limnocylindrales bacterium]
MSLTEKIPFLDLVTPHRELEPELTAVFHEVMETAGFVGGPLVEKFEREFAEFCDARFCVGVANGTDAVRFGLTAAGVQPGDIVITVPHTFIATTEAISQAGARLDFVDIDEQTYTMDVSKLREYLERECYIDRETGRPYHKRYRAPVTAIVPVHLYGQCADMDAILEVAHRYNLIVVEDACQAHGAEYFSQKENRWKKAGSMGHAAAFSFYPGKNLGACGEAGAVTTNREEVARKIRMLRDHGQAKKYYHNIEGYNGRLDALQAGLLSVKLRHLADWNRQRQQAASRYDLMLSSAEGVIVPHCPSWSRPVYHLYVVRVADREGLQKFLAEAKIDTGIHYPIPLHMQKAYETFGYKKGDFPVTEKVACEILSLPMYPQLQSAAQSRVAQKIQEFASVGVLR